MDNMRKALFLGCTIPARTRHYEASARRVCLALGVDLVDVFTFACCGFPLKAMDETAAITLAAANLTLARREGLDILTLCSSCTSSLKEAAVELDHRPELRREVDRKLERVGLRYEGGVKVSHIVPFLHDEVGLKAVGDAMKIDLSAVTVAAHHGCHFIKPSELHGFDSVEAPSSLDRLARLTGARTTDYPGKTKCCGGPVMAYDPETAVAAARSKLNALRDSTAEVLTVACPFCSVMYESNQKSIDTASGEPFELPVLFITQILGLGMGFSSKELGFKQNIVKPKKLLKRLGIE